MSGQEAESSEALQDVIHELVTDFTSRRSELSDIWLGDICERMKIRRKALARDAGLDPTYDVGDGCKKTDAEVASIIADALKPVPTSVQNIVQPASPQSAIGKLARVALIGSAIAGSGGLAALGGSSLLGLFGSDPVEKVITEVVEPEMNARLEILPPDED